MSSFDDKRRNLKRPFRKKSLQTGMSVIDTSVDATPLPPASYDTSTHQATTPVRRGIDPHNVRITFPVGGVVPEMRISSNERTQKIPLAQIRAVKKEEKIGDGAYWIVSLQMGENAKSKFYLYSLALFVKWDRDQTCQNA